MWSYLQFGKAALHLAAEHGHDKVAEVLLSHKAFVGAKTKLGMTPLHLAAENGFVTLVEILIMQFKAAVDALTLVRLLITLRFNAHTHTHTLSYVKYAY